MELSSGQKPPAKSTLNLSQQSQQDDVLNNIRASLSAGRKNKAEARNQRLKQRREQSSIERRPVSKKCKYEQYINEVEEGRFDATPEDLKDLKLNLTLDPEGCYIIPNRDVIVRTPTERVDAAIERYSNLSMVDKIRKAAEERVHQAYGQYMSGPCHGLIDNQKRIASMTRRIKCTDEATKHEVLMKIKEINQDLEAIRKANASLEKQIEVLEKAKATLVLEELGATVSIQYEKQRLSEVLTKQENSI